MNSIGQIFKINIFGESHNEMIGVTISGLAAGLKINFDLIRANLKRRRPKRTSETQRVELDDFEVVSGYFNGFTTGTPLTVLIYNKNVKSSDYQKIKATFRPSHVDYPASKKYLGYEDYRGGGHFSGRLTAVLVVAGSIAQQILAKHNVIIKTHISEVKDLVDDKFNENDLERQIKSIENNDLDVISHTFEKDLLDLIKKTSLNNDSIGAKLESVILNVEAGLGEPFFNKLDSSIASYLMTIPALKGISFGDGFKFSQALGSKVSDEYYFDEKVLTYSNHNGGIIGGLSSGMPIIVNSVVKPASSINKSLRSISRDNYSETKIKVAGRHDSSIFTRISVVVDSMLAIAILDAYCIRYGYMWQRGEK